MKFSHQVIFWAIVSVILIIVFGSISRNFVEAFFFITCLLPVIVGTSYFFNFYLVPNFLLQKRYARFFLYVLYTFIISVYLEMLILTLAFVYLADYQYPNLNPVSGNIYVLVITLYLIVFAKAFVLLVIKYYRHSREIESLQKDKESKERGYIVVKSNRKSVKIYFEKLDFIESLGDYVKFVISDGEPVLSKDKISIIEKKLPQNFIRVHRSFIANTEKVNTFSSEEMIVNQQSIPISRTYRKAVAGRLENRAE